AAANKRAAQSWEGLVDEGYIIAGDPDTVTEKLEELTDKLHVGHLMFLLQMGNMPRETAMYNTQLLSEKVLPRLRGKFSEYEDHWYPKMMPKERRATPQDMQK